MDYRTAKKIRPGDYVMPKSCPENLKVEKINKDPKQITFVLENGNSYNHKNVNTKCLMDSERGRFDETTGTWIPF